MQGYTHNGPVDCNVDVDPSGLKGKMAIVTGGMIFDTIESVLLIP